MTDPNSTVVDGAQRRQALGVTRSCIVQAPAGSGKTELLIQRILALLAVSRHPEEILAITFTRKAAAEMRKRLLEALEDARTGIPPAQEHAALTRALANAALACDHERGWRLLDNPSRLQVMTIDSFCAALVRRMPYLARFGEAPAIAEDPADLYRAAAERLLGRLERGGEGSAAIERLLIHLDNRLPQLRDLLVAMLGRRDQWLRHLDPGNPAAARPALENALRRHVADALTALRAILDDVLLTELTLLGSWAAGNLDAAAGHPLMALHGATAPPSNDAGELPRWLALCHLVLTGDDGLRKTVDARLGFPAGRDPVCREMKGRIKAALEQLGAAPGAVERFRQLRSLPATAYNDAQWDVLAALIELLLLADRELREVFRAKGQVDFVEIARGALAALGDDLAPGDLLLHLDSRLRHILVDEFQDTSRGQYELLTRLTAGWEPDDGRTLFVVGDPMQSIYRFREAEVGLYLRARSRGLGPLQLTPLVLRANFRSRAGLVDWFNATFAPLFPELEDETRGAVPYAAATAARGGDDDTAAVTLTCFVGRDDGAEAERIVALIRQARREDPNGSVAVLVRSRTHLAALIPALKTAGISWQAQEIDPLTGRAAIRDLLALTRAVLHPADRIAWLAILRAPWCGLGLNDLLALCGDHPHAAIRQCLTGLPGQQSLFPRLTADAATRLAAVIPVLEQAVAARGRVPLRRLIEAAWLGLNGPAGLTPGDLADAGEFFALLEELDEGGDLSCIERLEERLAKLFAAPDPRAGSELQLMTIHKAKGLEFDTVILPGLGRGVRAGERPLLAWQEQVDPARGREGLLLAPLPASDGDGEEPTYRAITRMHADKDRLESLRLLYVAATRARRRLHLLGHAERVRHGDPAPAAGSLLKAAWPVLSATMAVTFIESQEGSGKARPNGVPLRRLPPGWRVPLPPPVTGLAVAAPRRASAGGYAAGRALTLSRRVETGRIVGTEVHRWLERIARDGIERWPTERVAVLRGPLGDSLIAGGIPRGLVAPAVERTLTALKTVMNSPRGRWILAPHADAASEAALTGIVGGSVLHAVIDRTFTDEAGVRWVIDFKTSEPGDEGEEFFLEGEVERYRSQMENYRALMNLIEPLATIRCALYFPLIDAWREFD